jgi:hypothetical protein
MSLVTKFNSAELERIVELGTLYGANVAARELIKDGIIISPGAVYYWVKKSGNTGPNTRKPYAPRKTKVAKTPEVLKEA